ncbi:hypothetical protein KR51_00025870 [Rubidibacter lacunae KORDI 51-2]|uniref:Uncharacterized protein n=1 Tax=Rubidibacter lacunae KORDI 51-2 TaxID=582515 RepID=U5DMD9_9CHRO|nr:hypothetical protein KR51_00025870 [Rubidibacter lacunae KORDI 51-2]
MTLGSQRGVDWQFQGDARSKLKTPYAKNSSWENTRNGTAATAG